MLLLNFSHPLTPAHLDQIEALTGQKVERVIDVRTHLDHERPFVPQVKELVDRIGLSPEQWQTASLLINPPSFHIIAATLLAELHGRIGYFPAIIRLKPIPNRTPPQFQVAEVINLQAVREAARMHRR
ncbi:MAG TPA: CRISPR-associated protein Csx15 [Alphaproteobacteria bacterium]|nr:CRISPR-associated protein Csx15 [Alphaproteobacteria bacterium]